MRSSKMTSRKPRVVLSMFGVVVAIGIMVSTPEELVARKIISSTSAGSSATKSTTAAKDKKKASGKGVASGSELTKKKGHSPIEDLEASNSKVLDLIKAAGEKQTLSQRNEIKKEINNFLDFQTLAKNSLGKHWQARTSAERLKFTETLQGLIEANYIRQLKGTIDFSITYISETLRADNATVVAKFGKAASPAVGHVEDDKCAEGDDSCVVYEMHRDHGQWRVVDVTTAGSSLVDNYRSQFNHIIGKAKTEKTKAANEKQGFDNLMSKMTSKLEKMASES